MEVTFPLPTSSNVASDIQNSTIVEEGPRICPLCNGIVKSFFIHFNEKLLMCENPECDFPFGYEELQFLKVDNDFDSNYEAMSLKSKVTHGSHASGSEVSMADWSEIDKLNRVFDSEDSQSAISTFTGKVTREKKIKRVRQQENENKIKQNVEQIKKFNRMLFDKTDDIDCIVNEKWIKNLFRMQSLSGVKLLKEQELKKLKKHEPAIGMGELKIDINPSNDAVTSIRIEINQNENES